MADPYQIQILMEPPARLSVTPGSSAQVQVALPSQTRVAIGVAERGPQGEQGIQGPQGPAGPNYTLPAATTGSLGGVMIGGNIQVVSNGTISVPLASANTPGVVQVGANLKVNNGVLSTNIPSSNWSSITNTPTTVAGYGITDAVTANATYFSINPAGSGVANWPTVNSLGTIQRNSLINGSYYTASILTQSYDSTYSNGSINLQVTSNSTGTLKIGGLKVYKASNGLVYADLTGGPSFGTYNDTISANAGSASTLITRGYGDSRYRGYYATWNPSTPADLANVPYPAQSTNTVNLQMGDQRYVLKSSSPRPV